MFPRLDPKIYPIADDQQFAYELLAETKVLIVQGSGFNWIAPDHFRVVFLPNRTTWWKPSAASPSSWKATASATAPAITPSFPPRGNTD
jgi:aspartate/methionine/tyrosine aminotransferase